MREGNDMQNKKISRDDVRNVALKIMKKDPDPTHLKRAYMSYDYPPKPACIVGHIFSHLSPELLGEIADESALLNTRPVRSLARRVNWPYDEEATDYLSILQLKQDSWVPWELAVAETDDDFGITDEHPRGYQRAIKGQQSNDFKTAMRRLDD